MKFKPDLNIPEHLRPFYPYVAEENNSSQIVLSKNISTHVYTSFILALVNLAPLILFPDIILVERNWIYYSGFFIFLGSAALHLFEGRYSRIEINALGIKLVRNLLLYKATTFIHRANIQSIRHRQEKSRIGPPYGQVSVQLMNDKRIALLDIQRPHFDEVMNDTQSIVSSIRKILSVTASELPARR